jgi:hypothetical protein
MNYLKKGLYALLFLTAFSACKDDDEAVELTITGVDFTISVENDNGNEIGVTPTSTFTDSDVTFSVDFGDAAATGDSDVKASSGPKVTYAYPETSATYTIRVTASATGATGSSVEKEHTITFEAATVLADFEDASLLNLRDDTNAGGATFTIESQVAMDGSTSKVGVITNGGLEYEAPSINLTKHVDVRTKSIITMDFYQSGAASQKIGLKLEQKKTDNEASKKSVELIVDSAAKSGWQTLTFDFGTDALNSYPDNEVAEVVLDQYQKIAIFIGFGVALEGTFWVDNIAGGTLGDAIPDSDGDGVLDNVDKCKDVSGTEANGCNPPVVGTDPVDDAEGNGNITWVGDSCGYEVVANPSATGINTSANSIKYTDTGGQYANIQFELADGATFDLSTKNEFKLKVYVPAPAVAHTETKRLWLKLQDGTSAEPWNSQVQVEQTYEYDTWTELTFDFSAASARTDFTKVVVQFNGENNFEAVTAYIDDFSYGAPVNPADDAEGNGNITWVGDSCGYEVVANPSATGINTSANSIKYTDTGGQYANIQFELADGATFDLSTKNKFKLKVFVPTPAVAHTETKRLWLKLQDGTSAEPWNSQVQVEQTYEYDTWTELTFDFSAASARTDFNKVVVQFNGENNFEAVTAYIDDFSYTN